MRVLTGLICAVGLLLAWLVHRERRTSRKRRRSSWISEILAGGGPAAWILKGALTAGALRFSFEAAGEAWAGSWRGYLGLLAAAALIATTWIEMTAIYTDVEDHHDDA